MRLLTWILGSVLLVASINPVAAATRTPAQIFTCNVTLTNRELLHGTIHASGTGATITAARANAQAECGNKAVDKYFAGSRQADSDHEMDLAELCVNLDCQ